MTGSTLATELAPGDDSTGLALWRLTLAWQAAQRSALEPHGLTHVQFVLLASLTWLHSDAPVTQAMLADHAGTDPMMTSQVLRKLEGAGWVRRDRHPDDARAIAVSVTEAGVALANRAVADVEAVDRAFFGPASAERTRLTRDVLRAAARGTVARRPGTGG